MFNNRKVSVLFDKSPSIFPSKKNAIFLTHCAVSPLYHNAAKSMKQFTDDMADAGIAAMPQYSSLLDDFRSNTAKLLQTVPQNISYIHSTAEALSMIANGYPFFDGDQVISYTYEYPSNHYPWFMQKRRGVELVLLSDVSPVPELKATNKPKGWSMEELEKKVTNRTRIIALSHVQFTSGYAADLEELGLFCKEREIDLVIDCAQSLGSLPVYPEKYGIAAVVASSWKWLLGPKGSGLLFTSAEFREKITETMAGPGLMQQGLDYLNHSWALHQDGRKFEYSTIPWDHIAGINCVIRDIFLKYPPESIRKEIFHLQNKLLENLDRNFTKVLELPDKNRSGILVIDPLGDYKKIVEKLGQRGVITTAPIGYIRLAPHFYNDEEQMDIAASHLNELLEECV
jgi:cysteine desulfurase/selenocysteine lyase